MQNIKGETRFSARVEVEVPSQQSKMEKVSWGDTTSNNRPVAAVKQKRSMFMKKFSHRNIKFPLRLEGTKFAYSTRQKR